MSSFPEYLLIKDLILIKSHFVETTRKGKHLCSVNIALTPKTLIIASLQDENYRRRNGISHSDPAYPLESTKLKVFKKTRRQSLQVSFAAGTKYYELGRSEKRKIFWKLWCTHVEELNREHKIWPFVHFQDDNEKDEGLFDKTNHLPWTDKHLYLGSKRAVEDSDRPKPVPGLGPTEDIKLLYLKPKYFGCWDQSEHWVQCGNSSFSFNDQTGLIR